MGCKEGDVRGYRVAIGAGIAAIIAGCATVVGSVIVEATHQSSRTSAERDAVAPPVITLASPAAAPTPTLRETLLAADALARAGMIPTPQPSLGEVVLAVDALIKAGALPAPEPSLGDVLVAVDQLARAGVLTPPQPQPSLSEVLEAVAAIDRAQHAVAPPPQSAIEPPAPAPTPRPLPTAPPTPTPPPPAPALATGTGWYDDTYTARVFALVNARRAAAGLGPVSPEPRLTLAAADYAKLLSDTDTFSHTGPDGSTLVSRIEAAGFPFDVQVGEVLALGTGGWSPDGVVQAWMDSPSHREQVLGPYTRAGASCYFLPDHDITVRCVMDFAG
jgi:uncharacterized protein YkwD